MSFKINLFSSNKLLRVDSSSHKLTESIFTQDLRSYNLEEANLAKKVFLGGVRLMEEETQVQAVDIDHDSLDLPKVG